MYGLFSEISAFIGEPFTILSYTYSNNPFLFALFLGLIGAVAPCQLTGNISALTFYGSRTLQSRTDWLDVGSFIAGKVVTFTALGLFAWLFGQTFQEEIIDYFPAIRRVVGPLILFSGLVMLGVFRLVGEPDIGQDSPAAKERMDRFIPDGCNVFNRFLPDDVRPVLPVAHPDRAEHFLWTDATGCIRGGYITSGFDYPWCNGVPAPGSAIAKDGEEGRSCHTKSSWRFPRGDWPAGHHYLLDFLISREFSCG